MKLYPSVVGRGAGNIGYQFSASAERVPYKAWWIGTLRASDTTTDHQPILEMHCTGYGQPVVIASQWVVDGRSFGYTEYLQIELPADTSERKQFLDHPGQALYLDFMDSRTFLELSRKSNVKHSALPIMDVRLPAVYTNRAFSIPADMMASLLADVWSVSFQKLTESHGSAGQNASHTPIRLEVTTADHASETLDAGRAFYNQELLPLLPASVRHIISVSIGSYWSSVRTTDYMPALAITLPDTRAWHGKGSYQLSTGTYEMAGPQNYQAFGQALITGQNLDYYLQLHQDFPYTLFAANFLVAYYLFLIHHMLHTDPLEADTLSNATKLYNVLEKTIQQYHSNITVVQRRAVLLPVERDLIQKRATMCDAIMEDTATYDMFARKAFSLNAELKGSLQDESLETLKSAYVNLLCAPVKLNDWRTLPSARLWMETELRNDCLQADFPLFLQCVKKTLELHIAKLATHTVPIDILLTLYAGLEESPHRQMLGNLLTNAVVSLLDEAVWPSFLNKARSVLPASAAQRIDKAVLRCAMDSFPARFAQSGVRRHYKEYGDELGSSDRDSFFTVLSGAYYRNTLAEQKKNGTSLDSFIDTCRFFGWLETRQAQETIFTALHHRGSAAKPSLSQTEKETLLAFARKADEAKLSDIEQALTPIADNTTDQELLSFLSTLLPLLTPKPVFQPFTAGWTAAYHLQIQHTLKAVIADSLHQLHILLAPQASWEKHCRFPWLSIHSLDQLTQWHLPISDLLAFTDIPLTNILQRCTFEDLYNGLKPDKIGSGWFSALLKKRMASLLGSDRLSGYLWDCDNYKQMAYLQTICDFFLESSVQKDIRSAIRFAVTRTAPDSRSLIRQFEMLHDQHTAGMLLGTLLTSGSAGPWNPARWEDRMVLSYLSAVSVSKDEQQTITAILQNVDINLSAQDTLKLWDKNKAANVFCTILYVFHWFHEMRLESMETALLQSLLGAARFTHVVQNDKQLKHIFASAIPLDGSFPDPQFSHALLRWLFPS